jgi:ubiquinone/menaquinone biosynthesis C-methylase UbiE
MRLSIVVLVFVVIACSSKSVPYEGGPAMSQKGIRKTFKPILDFMEYKPGMSFADVGAGSGVFTVAMASLMDSSLVYIQDIDATVLNQGNVDKIIDYGSKESGKDLRRTNDFHITMGTVEHTNLPDATFDRIFSNGTVHNFTAIDSIMTDLRRKLKPNGMVFFRDSFKGDHGEGEFCSDSKCGNKLLTIDEFLEVMKRNGFTMVKRTPDMSGYPVFGFTPL